MTELIYDSCFLYKSGQLGVIEMQINDILILANNNFASNEKKAIKVVKLIIKDYKYLPSA